MKTLIDDTEVTARTYYYLLDWNERDCWKTIYDIAKTFKLCELEIEQYTKLFKIATQSDLNELGK